MNVAPARFADRHDAGRRLAERVAGLGLRDPLVYGLPRGGVPVAREVADRLGVPVEVLVARKIAVPGFPELGVAAIAEGLDEIVVGEEARRLGFDAAQLAPLAGPEYEELDRRVAVYRGGRARSDPAGRTVVVVDDGLATGVTALAALRAVRRHGPGRLIFATPVCAPDSAARLAGDADEVVTLLAPPGFEAVGEWYEEFDQLADAEVVRLLEGGADRGPDDAAGDGSAVGSAKDRVE